LLTLFQAVDKVAGAGLFFEFSGREVNRVSGAGFKKWASLIAIF
jgi:hypothetical protein